MNINKLLKFFPYNVNLILQSGGETYRVEETISIICQSFDVDEVEVFASPTAVMISILFNEEVYSIVKRINSRGIDLNMIHNINSLSREIYQHRLSIDVCEKKLKDISKSNSYPLSKTLFSFLRKDYMQAVGYGVITISNACALALGVIFISTIYKNYNLNKIRKSNNI